MRTLGIMFCSLLTAVALSGCDEATTVQAATAKGEATEACTDMSCCQPTAEAPAPPETQPAAQTVLPCCEIPAAQTDVPATQPAPQATPGSSKRSTPAARAGAWTEPAARQAFNLSTRVTDQTGTSYQLQDLVGKPLAVSFIYTRCPQPDMCPRITSAMVALQRAVAGAGLTKDVQLLLISYDPIFDTPDVLRAYGQKMGLRFDNAKLLRPEPKDFRGLLDELSVDLRPSSDGTFGHRIELILMDRQGRFVRDYNGQVWDTEPVVEDLKKLVAEGK